MKQMRYFVQLAIFFSMSCFLSSTAMAIESTMGSQANEELRLSNIAQDKNNAITLRASALFELGQYNGKNALIAIARATRDSEPALRETAILAVEEWADIARWDIVSPLIQDEDSKVRQQAVRVLLPLWSQLNQQQQAYMESAINEYLDYLKQLPTSIDTQLRLANVTLLTGQYVEAEIRYQDILEIAPANSRAYVELSELYRLRGDNQAVIGLLYHAIEALPANDSLHYSLALAYIRNGEYSDAIKQMNLAINLVEDKSAYQFVLAVMLQEKAPKQAISLLEMLTSERPSAQYQYALCNLYIDQKMLSDAKLCMNTLKNNVPESAFSMLNKKLAMAQ